MSIISVGADARRGPVLHAQVSTMHIEHRGESQNCREDLAKNYYDASANLDQHSGLVELLSETPFRIIGGKIAQGEELSYSEAFLGMSFVLSATNFHIFHHLKEQLKIAHGMADIEPSDMTAPAQTFLTAMAQRERLFGLTPGEIAGMAAAGLMDVNLRLNVEPYVLETGGMGADRGWVIDGIPQKVINASTLSALTLSALQVPVVKHGSYANTSKVGSTDAIQKLGVNIFQRDLESIRSLLTETHFYFSDAHAAKTLHDLSHSSFMFHETVNHIIGPMTPPVSRDTLLHKIIGVNHGIHPRDVALAYAELHSRGVQRVGNVVVISGLDEHTPEDIDINDFQGIQKHMMLDELSPYSSLVAVVRDGAYEGLFRIAPGDFGLELNANAIPAGSERDELMEANKRALNGQHQENCNYLAMNAGIGLFAAEYLSRADAIQNGRLNNLYLTEAFHSCHEALVSGLAEEHLRKVIEHSHMG